MQIWAENLSKKHGQFLNITPLHHSFTTSTHRIGGQKEMTIGIMNWASTLMHQIKGRNDLQHELAHLPRWCSGLSGSPSWAGPVARIPLKPPSYSAPELSWKKNNNNKKKHKHHNQHKFDSGKNDLFKHILKLKWHDVKASMVTHTQNFFSRF